MAEESILTNAEIDYAEEQQAFGTLVAHARAANDRMEKDLDIIKRQTAEIERLKTKPLWAELERAADRTRELEDTLREIEADALAASPEAAPRLPGAVLQANSDGTITKVEDVSDPLTAQDKSSSLAELKAMTHDNSHPMQTPYDRMVLALIERVEEVVKEMGDTYDAMGWYHLQQWADKLEG